MPDFRAAIRLHLIEISPALEQLQRQALAGTEVPMEWHRAIEDVPDGPLIVLANIAPSIVPGMLHRLGYSKVFERVIAAGATSD